jgi:hypothetical protein
MNFRTHVRLDNEVNGGEDDGLKSRGHALLSKILRFFRSCRDVKEALTLNEVKYSARLGLKVEMNSFYTFILVEQDS